MTKDECEKIINTVNLDEVSGLGSKTLQLTFGKLKIDDFWNAVFSKGDNFYVECAGRVFRLESSRFTYGEFVISCYESEFYINYYFNGKSKYSKFIKTLFPEEYTVIKPEEVVPTIRQVVEGYKMIYKE